MLRSLGRPSASLAPLQKMILFDAIFKHCAKVVAEMGGLNLQVQSRIGVSTTSGKGS